MKRGRKKGHEASNRTPIVHDGKFYNSIKEMAEKYNTSSSRIRYYLREDKPFFGAYIDYKI